MGELDPLLVEESSETEEAIRQVLAEMSAQPSDPLLPSLAMYAGYKTARESMVVGATGIIDSTVEALWSEPLSTAVPAAQSTAASEFLAGTDRLYMGKYVDDPKVIKAATNALSELYIEAGMPIGHGTSVDAFVAQARGQFRELSEWKTRQIVDTSVSRVRSWGRVYNMEADGVATYVIVGPVDKLTCEYCASMVGVEFSVAVAHKRLMRAVEAGEDNLATTCPFLTSYGTPEQVAQATPEELQAAGVDLTPFHPSCRHEPVFAGDARARIYISLSPVLRAIVSNQRRFNAVR